MIAHQLLQQLFAFLCTDAKDMRSLMLEGFFRAEYKEHCCETKRLCTRPTCCALCFVYVCQELGSCKANVDVGEGTPGKGMTVQVFVNQLVTQLR